ncbi:hypothetical protein G6011_11481 [Alternaria panax]|uniref:Uncharacterized protein n=1 Tax=Alternaria panax TaxID=48097 RepID=A0AAD4IDH1_9PLEO|nr:hypothetical protein G6011_11481 [Alternaria panax]
MPRGSLLRRLFKHGQYARSRAHEQSPLLSESEMPAVIESRDTLQTPSPPRTPESPAVHALPQIVEEESATATTTPSPVSSRIGSTVSDLASVVTFINTNEPVPVIDPTTLTTRDLLYTAINEATAATNAHIDTLKTTSALLQAITGFSETIEILKQEMKDKKRACRTKLGELEAFEEAVEEMRFPDDEAHVTQA